MGPRRATRRRRRARPTDAGIDVSKGALDLAIHDGAVSSYANTEAGIQQVLQALPRVTLVVLEATGRYHYSVTAAVVQPPVHALPDAATQERADCVARRRQLLEMRVAEQHRLEIHSKRIRQSIHRTLKRLDAELALLEDDLDDQIRQSPLWPATAELLPSVPGIGPHTARTLRADLPEFGRCSRRCSRREIAKLVGVAPHPRDAGTYRGSRHCWGGRAAVRAAGRAAVYAALYLAAVTAARCNPVSRPLSRRLRDAGTPATVALIAVVRQLLTILNSMIKTQQRWQPRLATTA